MRGEAFAQSAFFAQSRLDFTCHAAETLQSVMSGVCHADSTQRLSFVTMNVDRHPSQWPEQQ